MKKIITINIDERLNGLTIKELLVFFHVGRGKIEEFRVNKTIYLILRRVSKTARLFIVLYYVIF